MFDTPTLIQDLALFSEASQLRTISQPVEPDGNVEGQSATTSLFLRVWATADFYALDKSLMSSPPAVDVDISKLLVV